MLQLQFPNNARPVCLYLANDVAPNTHTPPLPLRGGVPKGVEKESLDRLAASAQKKGSTCLVTCHDETTCLK